MGLPTEWINLMVKHREAKEAHQASLDSGNTYAAAVFFQDACEAFDAAQQIYALSMSLHPPKTPVRTS